jgi:ATP/maltotriose-dependent transcriptional regulator MalT
MDDALAALDRQDWQRAYDLLAPLAADNQNDGDFLVALAEAAWWTGRLDECIATRERAFDVLESSGRFREAVRLVSRLFEDHCFKGRRIVAQAWLRRAALLLSEDTECPEYGFLLLREIEDVSSSGDLEAARSIGERALAIARATGDVDLEAESLQALGHTLVLAGHPDEGMALYDDAMLLVTAGKTGPFVAGKAYCSLMSACEELGDLRRAAEWTEVGSRWSESHPFAVFPGLCRVHHAHILQLRGAWVEAESQARRACDELTELNRFNMARALYEIAEIRRHLGDATAADDTFRRVAELGGSPQPGLALLRLSQGKAMDAAAGLIQSLAEETWNSLERARLLGAHVQVAIGIGDLEAADRAAGELESVAEKFTGPMLSATAATARGRVLLAMGDSAGAARTLRRALRAWRELGVPYEVATAQTLLGAARLAAGDRDEAQACFDAAAVEFRRLGDAVGAHELTAAQAICLDSPDGLSLRECEVLRLVASGVTNRKIAQDLHLSEKTVSRHLENIFNKIGVSSRAAATAYAFERGIVRNRT